jgi:transcriptional regulator with XRE-family HTH domain
MADPDEETAPVELATVEANALGARLRALRLASGLSLRGLAKKLDITPSAVSQIELGLMQPSVNRLLAIVTVLDIPLSEVFRSSAPVETHPAGPLITRGTLTDPVLLEDGVIFRRLSPGPVEGIDFFESTYPPLSKASGQNDLLRHEGVEVGTVSVGSLTIEFETETVVLGPGDSITYSCATPHMIHNASATESAVATWLILHPRH